MSRKTAIYGVGKKQRDFEYVFDHIHVDRYFDDKDAEGRQKGEVPFVDISHPGFPLKDYFIYVCKDR